MTSNNAFAARRCIVGVVVTNEFNMALYFPKREIKMAVMLTSLMPPGFMMRLGRRVAAQAIFLSFKICLDLVLFLQLLTLQAVILDLSVTTTPILSSGRVTSLCIRSIVALHKFF